MNLQIPKIKEIKDFKEISQLGTSTSRKNEKGA